MSIIDELLVAPNPRPNVASYKASVPSTSHVILIAWAPDGTTSPGHWSVTSL